MLIRKARMQHEIITVSILLNRTTFLAFPDKSTKVTCHQIILVFLFNFSICPSDFLYRG